MGLSGKVTGTVLAIVILVIVLLILYSIIQGLFNPPAPPTSNVADSQASFQSTLAKPGSVDTPPDEEDEALNIWLNLVMTLGVLFGTQLGEKLRDAVEKAEERQKKREADRAAREDEENRRRMSDQKPPREDIEDRIKKLQEESEKKVRAKADDDAKAIDSNEDGKRTRIGPEEIEERVKKAREASEKIVRSQEDLRATTRDIEDRSRANIRPTEDEIGDRVKKLQDASEKVIRTQAELDALTGDSRRFDLEADKEYIKDRIEKARDLSERVVRSQAKLATTADQLGLIDFEERVMTDLDNLNERTTKLRDLNERVAVAQSDLDTANGKLRDFEERVMTDLDNLNERTTKLRDLGERIAVAQSEFKAASDQLGLRDLEGRVITDLDNLNERTTKLRDLGERIAVAQSEFKAASDQLGLRDLEGRVITDLDNLNERTTKLRDSGERAAVAQSDFDTANGQLRDLERRVMADLDNLNERTTKLRDLKEHVTVADVGRTTDINSTKLLDDFKNALIDNPDDVIKRFKDFQHAKEHSLQMKREFEVFIGVDFSRDDLKKFVTEHEKLKTNEKIAHEISQIVTDINRRGFNDADNILDVFDRVEKQIEKKFKLFRESNYTVPPGLEDTLKKQFEDLRILAENNYKELQERISDIEDFQRNPKKYLYPPEDIDRLKKILDDEFIARTNKLEQRILTFENELLLPVSKEDIRDVILADLKERERIVVKKMEKILNRWESIGISPEDAQNLFRYDSERRERLTRERATLLNERTLLTNLGEEFGKLVDEQKRFRTYEKRAEEILKEQATDELNKAREKETFIDIDETNRIKDESIRWHENAAYGEVTAPEPDAKSRVAPDEIKEKTTMAEKGQSERKVAREAIIEEAYQTRRQSLMKIASDEIKEKTTATEQSRTRSNALFEEAETPVDTRAKLLLNQVIPEDIKKVQEELRKSKLTRSQALIEQAAEAGDPAAANIRNRPDSDRNKNNLKDAVAEREKKLKKDLLKKVDMDRLRKRVVNHPDTPLSITQSIVLLGGRRIPRNVDGTRMSLFQFINNHPEIQFPDIFKFMAAFGHALSLPDRVSERLSMMYDGSRMQAFFARQSERKGIIWASAVIDGIASSRIVKGGVAGLDKLMGPGLDFLQIAMTFSDSAFYGLFPDESEIIKPDTLKNIISKGVKAQLEGFAAYNTSAQVSNADDTTPGWPFAYAQYPMIAGPLSDLGMHGNDADSRAFRGDPYYNQVFIDTAVDAIREKMLRDPNEIFESGVSFKDLMIAQLTQNGYNTVINASDDALVSYVDSVLSPRAIDELYGRAFSNVCSFYGGKVYEDYYIMGSQQFVQSGTIKNDGTVDQAKMVGNRRRFQCGFRDEPSCTRYANKWATVDETGGRAVYGDYAEWFTSDDIDTYILRDPTDSDNIMIDRSDPDHPNGIPLFIQPAFRSGACIVTTSGNASLCRQGGGEYDAKTHMCKFTPQYCQSIGTCYCSKDGGSCFLPNTTMEALAFFFGTGGVREWIKINGCHSSTCNPTSEMEYSRLATNGGDQWFADMFANQRNWGPGLKASIGTPSGAMMFTGAVLGLAVAFQATTTGTAVAAAISASISASVAATVEAAAITAGFTEAAAALGAEAAASAIASSEVLGPAAILVAIGAGIAMWVEAGQGNYSKLINPTTDEAEYTLGGWSIISRSDGSKYVSPKRMSFADGWVTKPIPYHPVNAMFSPYTKVSDFGFGSQRFFDTNFPWSQYACSNDHGAAGDVSTLKSCLQANPGLNVGQRTCYQNRDSPMSPKDFEGPPHWIRAASDGSQDSIWCIPPFPVNNGTNGTIDTTRLFDTAIGKPAEITTEYLTNNTWTDGTDSRFPLYPTGTAARSGNTSGSQWHYQLVYDSSNVCNSQYLWITPYLQKYFSDMRITNMRKYCCTKSMLSDPSGRIVDPKCWGYMSVRFQSWNLKPSTNIPASKTALKTLNYTPVPTCQPGQYYERIQNKCLTCPANTTCT